MDDDRNLGVTEARFGLTLLICLLLAIGYIVLLRLGSTSDSAIEIRPDVATQPVEPPKNHDDEPRVLPIEPQLAERPVHPEDATVPSANPVVPTGPTDSQRR